MKCNKCNLELTEGYLELHASYKSRVSFTDQKKENFTNKFLSGSIFDRTCNNEINILSTKKDEKYIKSFYCRNCMTILVVLD